MQVLPIDPLTGAIDKAGGLITRKIVARPKNFHRTSLDVRVRPRALCL